MIVQIDQLSLFEDIPIQLMKNRIVGFLLLTLIAASCAEETFTAQEIVDAAIEKAGGERYQNSEITFDFRDHSYSIKRDDGIFEMARFTFVSIDSTIKDFVYNYGYKRYVNDSMISVPDSMAPRYKASVNSVIYFACLPFGLNDHAAQKSLLGRKEINGVSYCKIKVTFSEQGGGEDYQDQFLYWIHPDSFTVDFLAYEYFTDGGGLRFREAFNPRVVNGIRFTDYINYKPASESNTNLQNIDDQFLAGELTELSRIQTENVSVSLLDE